MHQADSSVARAPLPNSAGLGPPLGSDATPRATAAEIRSTPGSPSPAQPKQGLRSLSEVDNNEIAQALHGLTVLERGWLSSNNVLIHPVPGEAGLVMVDTGHVNHAEQTLALVDQVLDGLGGVPLAAIVNTHLHSDHCGGNAALKAAHGAPIWVAPGMCEPVQQWDARRLTYDATGQRCARYTADGELSADRPLRAGGRNWEVIPAPGHDPDSVMLFDRPNGVLISADALWENGFGVVFPEVAGEPGFEDVGAVLDLIESLPVRVVIPGHGRPFMDIDGALGRARSRLARFRADPARHARHAAKVLIKYHLMETGEQAWDALLHWAAATPLLIEWPNWHGPETLRAPGDWAGALIREMIDSGVLTTRGGVVFDGSAPVRSSRFTQSTTPGATDTA